MAVDLGDLVDVLKRAVSPPGTDLFPNATDDNYVGYLSDAFWEVRMLGMLGAWTESDGSVSPVTGTVELPREQQQFLILFAAINIVTNELKNMETLFRTKAGPVEFETQKAGALLRDVLTDLKDRRTIVERYLFGIGAITDYYIDAVSAREDSMRYGFTWWERS